MNSRCVRLSHLRFLTEYSYFKQWSTSGIVGCPRQISSSSRLDKGKKSSDRQKADDRDDVSSKLKTAARSVAESLPGDADKTESVLLQQLRAHANLSKTQKGGRETTPAKSESQMSSLLSSMKVQKEPTTSQTGTMRPRGGSPQDRKARLENVKLFGGPGLGIFTEKTTATAAVDEPSKGRSLWDEVEAEKLDRLSIMPPENAFEEMIQMTKEGKLWTFPIDNEAGMVEEQNIGFHEHVFLDRLIEDFPHRGPIRHFMELVTTGLSKNPYLSVKQKQEHIEWFSQYFKEKQGVLEENLGPDGIMKSITENQLQ